MCAAICIGINNLLIQNSNFNNSNSNTPTQASTEEYAPFLVSALSGILANGVMIENCNFNGTTCYNNSGVELVTLVQTNGATIRGGNILLDNSKIGFWAA